MGLFTTALAVWITAASAAPPVERTLTYDVTSNGSPVGTRTTKFKFTGTGVEDLRIIESQTSIQGSSGSLDFEYSDRTTVFAGENPASFHAVIQENGRPREVQAQWTPAEWTITVVTGRSERTFKVPTGRIDLSTADVFDPVSRVGLPRFETARVLATETGDIWKGAVTPLGPSVIRIDDESIEVTGVSWESPAGRSEFYYASSGWLVRFRASIMGVPIEGVLADPPPPGPDEFPVAIGAGTIDEDSLD